MYLKIKKLLVVPDKFSSHIKITMVGLYRDNGEWVKWVKLEDIAERLENNKIYVNNFVNNI